MKTIFINTAKADLYVASTAAEFYGIPVTLGDKLGTAILEEQKRKFELSRYLELLREAGRANTDPLVIEPPSFLIEVIDNVESTTQPKAKRGRKPRVSQ
jgi:hypothetical protein